MAGLLDDFSEFIKTPGGQGLLSAAFGGLASARADQPWNNLGRAGMSGLAGYGNAQDRDLHASQVAQQKKMQDAQMTQMQYQADQQAREAEKEKAITGLIKANSMPARPVGSMGIGAGLDQSLLPADLQVSGMATNALPAQPARFNFDQFTEQLAGVDPMKSLQYKALLQKDDAPITVAPGASLVDKRTMKPIFTAPKEFTTPAEQQGYELAKSQGYGGSFMDYQTALKRAGASSVNVPINLGQKGLDNTLKVRSDFRSEPIYKAHGEVQSAHSQITTALKQNSPAGDLAGATKLMKILDPGSVVRESELGMAMAASGMLDRVQNYGSMVLSGQKLTPTQRKDFQSLSDALLKESQGQYSAKREEYKGIAERNQLSVPDILGPEPKMEQKAAAQPEKAPMRGQVVQGYKFKGGNPADQSNWEKQ